MKVFVIGSPGGAERLAASLSAEGLEVVVPEPAGGAESEVGSFAAEFIALERALLDGPADAAVLADAGDRALAGALVATKLLIPAAALAPGNAGEHGGPGPGASNGHLLAQLADRVFGSPSEVAAWAASAPASGPSAPEGG